MTDFRQSFLFTQCTVGQHPNALLYESVSIFIANFLCNCIRPSGTGHFRQSLDQTHWMMEWNKNRFLVKLCNTQLIDLRKKMYSGLLQVSSKNKNKTFENTSNYCTSRTNVCTMVSVGLATPNRSSFRQTFYRVTSLLRRRKMNN